MSLFGKILGSIAAPIVGGLFGRKSEKNAAAFEAQRLRMMRTDAEAAGFNPLSALMAGAASAYGNPYGGHASLAQANFAANAVQSVSDVLTGKTARDLAREETEMDLMKVELERLRKGGAAATVARTQQAQSAGVTSFTGALPITSMGTVGNNALPATQHAPKITSPVQRTGQDPFANATATDVIIPLGTAFGPRLSQNDMPPNVVNQHVGPVSQSFTTRSGNVYSLPVAPDPEEIAAGFALEAWDQTQPERTAVSTAWDFVTPLWGRTLGFSQIGDAQRMRAERERLRQEREPRKPTKTETRKFLKDNYPTVYD